MLCEHFRFCACVAKQLCTKFCVQQGESANNTGIRSDTCIIMKNQLYNQVPILSLEHEIHTFNVTSNVFHCDKKHVCSRWIFITSMYLGVMYMYRIVMNRIIVIKTSHHWQDNIRSIQWFTFLHFEIHLIFAMFVCTRLQTNQVRGLEDIRMCRIVQQTIDAFQPSACKLLNCCA